MKDKNCFKCKIKQTKDNSNLRKDSKILAFMPYCKDCEKEYWIEYKKRNKERRNLEAKIRYQVKIGNMSLLPKTQKSEKICSKCNTLLPTSSFSKRYDSGKIRGICNKCYREYHDEYSIKNYNILREKARDRERKRKEINPSSKLKDTLRSRIRAALKSNAKKGKTEELLGCSIKFLKSYLESKFLPGMNWNNWTVHGWHIDHIRPCASFDLTNIEQQKQCFHYTNLQPLWAKDNRKKHDKY